MSDNREQLQEQIKVQGEVVRKLKAAKESKEKVSLKFADAIFSSK
jgi:histidyl-tRNA synthetase